MTDWEHFKSFVTWYPSAEATVTIGTPTQISDRATEIQNDLPALSTLLNSATTTPVTIDDSAFELLAWPNKQNLRMGWLCPVKPHSTENTHPDHQQILKCFGGITERFNEPDNTWLLDMDEFLTPTAAQEDGTLVEDYDWIFEQEGKRIPIDMPRYYCVAREANGNATFCHRQTGEIVLFAPDQCFDFVSIYPNCPENSLYQIQNAATFRDWVENIAKQWLGHIKSTE